MHLVCALCSCSVRLDQVPGNALIFKCNNVLRISWGGALEVTTILNMRSKIHPKVKPILNSCCIKSDGAHDLVLSKVVSRPTRVNQGDHEATESEGIALGFPSLN